MPQGRKPVVPGEKTIVVGLALGESEVKKLDALAQKMRHTRSGYAAYLLMQAIERELQREKVAF